MYAAENHETVKAAAKHIGGGYETEEDCLRNFYMYRKANTGNKPVFMLDAHGDEVGFMVHSIRPNGTLRFVALGGWNVGSLPSSRVLVRNSEGNFIPGIIAAKPVHFMSASEKASSAADIASLSIDIGAVSAEDAVNNFKIRIGEPIVPDVKMEYDEEHDLMFGRPTTAGSAAPPSSRRSTDLKTRNWPWISWASSLPRRKWASAA